MARKIDMAKKTDKKKKSPINIVKTVLLVFIVILVLFAAVIGGGLIYLNGMTERSIYVTPPSDYVLPTKPPFDHATPDTGDPDVPSPTHTAEPGIHIRDPKHPDILNILLAGSDARPGENRGRSDSLMVLSYNTKTGNAKLASILRDSLVPIQGYGWNKINAAYSFGGPDLTINTVNLVYDLDIQKYIIIGFDGLAKVVDKMGGVRVKVTKEEADYYKSSLGFSSFPHGDQVTLNGAQALTHCRNRHQGGDWQRTRRQRDVLTALMKQAMEIKNPAKLLSMIDEVHKMVRTNLSVDELYNMALSVIGNGTFNLETTAVPFEGTWKYETYKNASVIDFDIAANSKKLNEFIYG